MFSKIVAIGRAGLTVVFSSVVLLSQSTPAGPSSSAGLEFPVMLRQNVIAGTTPVGTKVQAKLVFATMVGRVVVPQGAILSGEVTESAPKSATDASRLGIRMDSAQWKNGSATIKVYLTAWFYPVTPPLQDLSTDPRDDVAIRARRRRGAGNSTDPNPSASTPFPGRGTGTDPAPPPPSSEQGFSKHRVLMKGVESARNNDGTITLVSKSVNIKLDKDTAYVLAGNPLPAN
jgi:hypothetical protein